LILEVVVHPADIQDRDGAKLVLKKLDDQFPRLEKIWADGGYAGKLVDWAKEIGQWVLEIVKRPETAVGFEVLPHRWIVERTFAWLGRFRRLSKDYEVLIETSEAMIRIAMIRLMVRRLGAR
jgi:putative transposase